MPDLGDGPRTWAGSLRDISLDDGAVMQKRIRIMHHATRAFFAHGYENANIQDIAEAAGVSKYTIYRYFIDKADLFKHVMIDAAEHISNPLKPILQSGDSVHDTLVKFACTYASRLLDQVSSGHRYYEVIRLILPLSVSHKEISWICRDIYRENIHKPVVEYFSELVEKGIFRSEEPNFLALNFVQMIFLNDIATIDPSQFSTQENIEISSKKIVSIFLHGISS